MSMQDKYISDMINRLSARGLLNNADKQAASESLKTFWDEYAVDIWQFGDIAGECAQRGYPLSRKAGREILAELESGWGGESGFSWDSLNVALRKWFEQQNWFLLTDEERADYDEKTCVWGIIVTNPIETASNVDAGIIAQGASQTEIFILSSENSLLDAIAYARTKKLSDRSDLKIEVFSLPLNASWENPTRNDLEEEQGTLVWSSDLDGALKYRGGIQ